MTDKAAIPDAWSPSGKPRGTRDPNSTSTHAPKPSWIASPRSQPISPPTAARGSGRESS